jgi:predicted metal-dependent peptidase
MSDSETGSGPAVRIGDDNSEVSDSEAVVEATTTSASEHTYGLDTTKEAQYATEAPQDLVRTSILMIQNQNKAYYGHFLAEIKKHRRYDIKTVRVTVNADGIALAYNPYFIKFCVYQGQEVLESVIEHELLHLTYLHPELMRINVQEGGKDSSMFSAAMDVITNDQLDSSTFPMCSLCSQEYVDDLKTPEGVKRVRQALVNKGRANKECPSCFGTGLEGLNSQKVSIAANSVGRSTRSYRFSSTLEAVTYLEKERAVARALNISSQHGWNSTPLPDTESDRLNEEIIKTMVNHISTGCKSFGSAGDALAAFKQLTMKKRVPYILQIRAFLGASMKSQKAPTRYRPSRRFGWDYPGIRSHPSASYVLACDTSGSMGEKEIQEIVNELSSLKEYSDKIDIRVILFHDSIYADLPIEDFEMEKFKKKYRTGGTDFDAVFEHIFGTESAPKQTPPTTVVVLTDGYCSIRSRLKYIKSRCNLAWLVTDNGTDNYIKNWDKGAQVIEIKSSS